VHADRIDNVWGESAHGRSAPLQPRPLHTIKLYTAGL
jgi:hypothetical protein